ncbi:MAG: diguanylate cyclase [Acidobacteria bacterium]|nr:diguanylate cyclase [Acidobacteriota bacterium]
MEKKNAPTYQSQVFQWAVIVCGGVVWLGCLVQLLLHSTASTLFEITLFTVSVVMVSFKPVYITTPGNSFSHKRQLSFSLSDPLTFLMLVLYGPAAAVTAAGIDGLIASMRTVKRWQSNVFTLGMMAVSIFGGAYTYLAIMRYQSLDPFAGLRQSALRLVLPLFAMAAVYCLINSWTAAILLALRYRRNILQQWVDNHLWVNVMYFPLVIVAVVLYFCLQQFGWISVISGVPALLLIYFSYEQYNKKVEEKIRKIEEMNGLNLAAVRSLALAIDVRSGATTGHAERVKIYVRGLARLFNLSELETQALEAGAMLRDVGMLAVPDHILTKPGHLTPAEFEKMKMHATVGAEILSQINFPYPVVPIVRHHHERWDGEGYPDGLKGEEIPITARILSVADCFDAARENRHHRNAMSLERAVTWLRESAGKHFDPEVVEVFIKHLPEFESEIASWVQSRQGVQADSLNTPAGKIAEARNQAEPEGNYAKSLEQISGAHREVVMLYELAQTVGRSLSLQDTLTVLLTRIGELVPATTSAVLLKEKESDALKIAQALGEQTEAFHQRVVGTGKGNVGWVFANQTPMLNAKPQPDIKALHLPANVNYKTSLIIPLTKENETLGTLALYTNELEQYSSEHIRIVEAIAKLAGDAIANALHYEETEATAYTDRLTGLPNLRAILRAFDTETNRARRTNQTFTFLMMDLDGFKKINDTLGHHAGDLFLKEISKQIKAHVRTTDFLGRYAGDEFVAILPNTKRQEIAEMIARIKHAVDNHVVTTEDGKIARGGISIGVAECDGNEVTLEELMSKADSAMYADKAERKRRQAILQNNDQVIPFPIRKPA